MRKTETIDREAWNACLDHMDGDKATDLQRELNAWQDGDTCRQVEVSTDSLGRIDSESSPRPSTETFCDACGGIVGACSCEEFDL